MPHKRPTVTLKPGAERRLLQGHPWVYSNEIMMTAENKALTPGCLVRLAKADGARLGTAMFNARPLISARLLSRDPEASIDAAFFKSLLARAAALRDRLIGTPYYRLIHAEADGMPGAVIDRFNDAFIIQAASAGMEALAEPLIEAIDALFNPRIIQIAGEGPARDMEGLPPYSRIAKGALDGPIPLIENGARFLADPREGQKTGWFFDQRDNRALTARLAAGCKTLLDLYSYMGGFGIEAALANPALHVTCTDRSAHALDLARQAATLNGVADRIAFERAEAFDYLTASNATYDMVVADPPAFVKSRKDFNQGARAYRKLARLAAGRVTAGGLLFIASCSHNMPSDAFAQQVARGIADSGRTGRILYASGAAPDHPVHPWLPESAYLKALFLQID